MQTKGVVFIYIIDKKTTKDYNLPVDDAKITKRIYVAIMFHKYFKISCHYELQIWRNSYLMSYYQIIFKPS